MIIVRIKSGLGNQMFQYAFYRNLKEKNITVKMDLSLYNNSYHLLNHNGYELNRLFSIKEDIATAEEIKSYSDEEVDLFSRFRRKIFLRKKTHYVPKEFKYSEDYMKLYNVLLDGYWQSEKFFKDITDIIREEYRFTIKMDLLNQKIADKIINQNAVSIHLRRGDYFSQVNYKKFGIICNMTYYENAIRFIENRIMNPYYYVFSDDINWAKENLKHLKNVTFVDWNNGRNSYRDMQLMSLCKCNIIANSSFSWWAAWLNNHQDKLVLVPSKWFGDTKIDTSDLIPESWIYIPID